MPVARQRPSSPLGGTTSVSSHSPGEAALFFKKIRRTAKNISLACNYFSGFFHTTANLLAASPLEFVFRP